MAHKLTVLEEAIQFSKHPNDAISLIGSMIQLESVVKKL